MRAGQANRRIAIEAPDDVKDGAGGFERGWLPVRTIWARCTPTGGREALIAGTLQASQG